MYKLFISKLTSYSKWYNSIVVWVPSRNYNWKNNDGVLVRFGDLEVKKQEAERYFDVQIDIDTI